MVSSPAPVKVCYLLQRFSFHSKYEKLSSPICDWLRYSVADHLSERQGVEFVSGSVWKTVDVAVSVAVN